MAACLFIFKSDLSTLSRIGKALDLGHFSCSKILSWHSNPMLWVLKRIVSLSSQWDDSFEYPQHRIWLSHKINIVGKRPVHSILFSHLHRYIRFFAEQTHAARGNLYPFSRSFDNLTSYPFLLTMGLTSLIYGSQLSGNNGVRDGARWCEMATNMATNMATKHMTYWNEFTLSHIQHTSATDDVENTFSKM